MSSASASHIVVVGGGLAAARSCEHLRRLGHAGPITMVTAEAHLPYDRPPLSKAVLKGELDDTTIPVALDALDVTVRHNERAVGLRCADRVLLTTEGEIPYDGAVLATGADPIRLAGSGEQLTLRTIEDALALRARLLPGARVSIIGASWIGAEVATAALSAGCRVTCFEAGPAPMAKALGEEIGKHLLDWWRDVDVRLDVAVAEVDRHGVLLDTGDHVTADVVVTGVGVRPQTHWLIGSGVELDRGVVVDEWMRAAPGVVAVGDLACWWSRRWSRRMRVEHWDDAAAGAAVAAASLLKPDLCGVEAHDPIPYFWSDQFGHKLQYVGAHAPTDRMVRRIRENGSWSAFWMDDSRRMTAALVTDLPRETAAARLALAVGAVADPSALADPTAPLPKAG